MNEEYLLLAGRPPELLGPFPHPEASETALRHIFASAVHPPEMVLSIYYGHGSSSPRIEPLGDEYLSWLKKATTVGGK